AVDLPDGTPAVLKVARERERAATLAKEAWMSSLAPSPRLPRLLGIGVYRVDGGRAVLDRGGLPCLLLARAQGDRLVADGARSAADALAIARDLAEALAALHEVGLSHGDV